MTIRHYAISILKCLQLLFEERIIHCDLKLVSSDNLWYLEPLDIMSFTVLQEMSMLVINN